MTATSRGQGLTRFLERLRALFNLNDPGWGRGSGDRAGSSDEGAGHKPEQTPLPPPSAPEQRPQGGPPSPQRPQDQQQPPDLGELLGDLNRKLGNLFGGGGGNRPSGGGNRNGGGGFPGGIKPPALSGGLVGIVAIVLVGLWLVSGFFVVQEGHRAVITTFGKYQRTVSAGLNYRLPAPIGGHEMVDMRIKTMDIGSGRTLQETGLNEYAMLTQDENIVEILFTVQYRINNAEDWLFNTANQPGAIAASAESAVREVVGKMSMDEALAGRREDIAPALRTLMQAILDRYQVGVEVVAINMQPSGVRPPEMVRAAFDDVLRADQERERVKNEAEAYANQVIPRAVGEASRMKEEAEGYRERVTAQAQGDAARFDAVLGEYRRAPSVTRERMYLETMEEVYRNSNKVLVDPNNASSLMYLPLDKLMEQSNAQARSSTNASSVAAPASVSNTAPSVQTPSAAGTSAPSAPAGQRRPSREVR
ncbi:FtsH protease activity modulator HflK [Lampropedia puyangensis]|uniref:Protein HflK n=1 Tax=Lampropedia puyangensis TaxID=1330072 RepID=A0A4S8F3K0_9BURK|nr:FtsH protease activity modulator HflK [Lampropedia puyangensis]THU01953.1 FtsH protease activity modulator HflK [Lampropedia puyangensis]